MNIKINRLLVSQPLEHCLFSTLWPIDAIWWHRSGWTLAQVMACCLTAPSHYLSLCWLIISKALWDSCEGNLPRNVEDIYPWYGFENYHFSITATSPWGQWFNGCNMISAFHDMMVVADVLAPVCHQAFMTTMLTLAITNQEHPSVILYWNLIVITGGTAYCHDDNLQYHRW